MDKTVKILLILFFLFSSSLYATTSKIDSLKKELENSNGLEKADLQSLIGKEYLDIENFPKAISYYRNALTYYENNEIDEEMISCYRYLGNSYLELSIFDMALENYKNALTLSKDLKNEDQIARTYHNLGTAYLTIDEYEKALNEYFLEALSLFKKLGNKKEEARCLNNIGIIHGALGDIDSSLVYFNKALTITREFKDSLMISASTSNIGYAHLQVGRTNKAIVYFKKSLHISTLINEKSGIANASINLARAYNEKHDFEQTISYALVALEMANKTGSRDIMQDTYKLLADVYFENENDKTALEYYKNYTSIHDSIYSEKSGQRLANMMALFEHENRERKIKELNAEKKIQDEKIKTQMNWLIISIFVLVIVVSISIYIIRQNKKITLANKDLVRKSLEIIQVEKTSKYFKATLPEDQNIDQVKYAGSAMSLAQKDQILNDILEAFEKKKMFVEQDITLGKLANEIGTNNSYISQVINERFNKNFSNFINEYRIKEAIRLLYENENRLITIEGISQTVGFKSKSAFNNAFKKYTGVTPSFFEKSSKDFSNSPLEFSSN